MVLTCRTDSWDFPGDPAVRNLHFHCWGHRFNPWWGNLDPTSIMAQPKKEKKNPDSCSPGSTLLHPKRIQGQEEVPAAFTCMSVKSLQSCPTLRPYGLSLPSSSVHGILQERILEWVGMFSFRGSSGHRDQTCISYISCTGRWVLYY